MNSITLSLYKHRFESIAEEMGVTLCRSAHSSNIKERRDYSCAIFDAQGRTLAQAEHLPVHLGSMPMSVQSAIQQVSLLPGDSVIVNDPFAGGTHLPDITLIDPVFIDGQLAFYVANRAHHADVGGMTPGSMPLSSDIFQEGLRIPPLKWRKQGQIDTDLLALILNNVRTPQEREGDLLAQWAANQTAIQRLHCLSQKYGLETLQAQAWQLQDYAENMMRHRLLQIPDGEYAFVDYLEDDGLGHQDLRIQVCIRICEDQAEIDFSGTAPQTVGCINTILAVTVSSVLYVFRCLLEPDVPSNAGLLRPLHIIAPEGSLLNARFPSAVVGGNVETSQRIVDVLLGALSQALPDLIPAASYGSMNNLMIGGIDTRFEANKAFAYYETIAGGHGATAFTKGASGKQAHMTNTLNTPIEALELSFPFRLHAYQLRQNSGGAGLSAGGDGIVRELEVLTDAQVTILSERRRLQPYGLAGGQAGQCGVNLLIEADQTQHLPGKTSFYAKAGSRIRIETPGGGGWGSNG